MPQLSTYVWLRDPPILCYRDTGKPWAEGAESGYWH